MKRTAFLSTFALLAAWAFAAGAFAAEPLRIGSKRFTESYILAQVLAQTAAPHLPTPPEVKQGLGNTAIVYEALRSGSIDLYPEYAGTIALEILKSNKPMSLEEMNRGLAPLGLAAAIPLGFNDGYALAMRGDEAQRLKIRTLGDLARHTGLKIGLSNEFLGRADGWPGLARAYGFSQQPTGLDHGLAYDAIAAGQIDVMDIYTTDAKIGHLKLTVLQDDRHYFPRYDALVLYRLEVPQKFPKAWAALTRLSGTIDEGAMIAMNARAELQGAAFDAIAREHLAGTSSAQAAPSAGFASKLFGPDLGRLTVQHLGLVVVSVATAALIAIPLGLLAFPHPRVRSLLLGATGLLQTIPSLALLAILIWVVGAIGVVPAVIALTLYALLPIMRNTVTGLAEVPQGLRDAAAALGLSPGQSLRLVQLPLAMPTILAGVRTAVTIAIGTATIAAFVGAGGYGERIVTGLAINDSDLLLAGAIPAAVLALASELVFELIARRSRPQ
ncbi:glycine betaine ABC transporter substrate-binding protein [Caenimonas koreensis]|uniref:ABC transporter permease subunit n=1 Tax=Caenimonas koreensis DSM 17982 TaxID=1121255 RepID=A0A844AXM6_9BURK|nr:glycine betaine ABC transporter substrate-binding protein [Caenimonas koreensis]MRD49125.1 ABC transporter permease subunit [Caenimonas koreensis DSM 17982]